MKRTVLLVVVVFIMVFATACGGSAPTQAPTVQPTATEAPAQPAATEPPAAASTGTEVDITLADNTIDSSLTTFKAGVPYTFVITNKGNHEHNFNISQPVSIVGSLDAAEQTALLVVPRSQLGIGSTATVQYTFPDTSVSKQWEFSCLITRHYNDGMKLSITVTK